MRAAIIDDNVVTNIIIINPDTYKGSAVHTGDLPVAIGDVYDGTDFWRGEEKVTVPNMEEEYKEALRILGVEV